MAIGIVKNSVDHSMKLKRIKINNDETEEINLLDWELIRKNYGFKDSVELDELKMSLSYDFDFDIPGIANLPGFMVNLEVFLNYMLYTLAFIYVCFLINNIIFEFYCCKKIKLMSCLIVSRLK